MRIIHLLYAFLLIAFLSSALVSSTISRDQVLWFGSTASPPTPTPVSFEDTCKKQIDKVQSRLPPQESNVLANITAFIAEKKYDNVEQRMAYLPHVCAQTNTLNTDLMYTYKECSYYILTFASQYTKEINGFNPAACIKQMHSFLNVAKQSPTNPSNLRSASNHIARYTHRKWDDLIDCVSSFDDMQPEEIWSLTYILLRSLSENTWFEDANYDNNDRKKNQRDLDTVTAQAAYNIVKSSDRYIFSEKLKKFSSNGDSPLWDNKSRMKITSDEFRKRLLEVADDNTILFKRCDHVAFALTSMNIKVHLKTIDAQNYAAIGRLVTRAVAATAGAAGFALGGPLASFAFAAIGQAVETIFSSQLNSEMHKLQIQGLLIDTIFRSMITQGTTKDPNSKASKIIYPINEDCDTRVKGLLKIMAYFFEPKPSPYLTQVLRSCSADASYSVMERVKSVFSMAKVRYDIGLDVDSFKEIPDSRLQLVGDAATAVNSFDVAGSITENNAKVFRGVHGVAALRESSS